MKYKFNIFTGNFDLVSDSGPVTDAVIRFGPTVNKSIPRWVGDNQDVIDGSKVIIQDGGGIEAQAFLFHRYIEDSVEIRNEFSMIATDIIIDGGEIIINSDAELVII
jgi:hypothetical protein